MDENLELLKAVYKNADMGVKTLTDLLNGIRHTDNKIKGLIEEELKCYESYVKDSKKLLEKYKEQATGTNFMTDMMTKMGINKEIKNDNSDSAIASMVIEGFTMGNLDLDKLITNYEGKADKKVISLAKKLYKFGEEEVEKLKKYV